MTDRLRALAEAATPGPWAQQHSWAGHVVPKAHEHRPWGFAADPAVMEGAYARVIATVGKPEADTADARYIAALSPDVALALVEAARALEELLASSLTYDTSGGGSQSWCSDCQMDLLSPHLRSCLWERARIASDALRGVPPATEEDRS